MNSSPIHTESWRVLNDAFTRHRGVTVHIAKALGIGQAIVNKWAEPCISEENPFGSGAKNILDRTWGVMKTFIDAGHRETALELHRWLSERLGIIGIDAQLVNPPVDSARPLGAMDAALSVNDSSAKILQSVHEGVNGKAASRAKLLREVDDLIAAANWLRMIVAGGERAKGRASND